MTIPRLAAMNRYWQDNPPLHSMVAAYFGIGKVSQTSNTPRDPGLDEAGQSLFDLLPRA
ncbi:hypothetical protein [Paludibacterium purpuratum]|uniref:Uncharacterized protein n=1 Tax=Paludibacterium purpuratum TaxID=1144873 RepID=A0A4R7BEV5_9NEIS|nr:hypothetical protein [Paludibacterium purpuratum]TDR82207.1 hypothetical protein DFP86_102321 [Paludibacterium purpuratum]